MFNLRNLSVLAYANGFTLWHYKATETTLDAVQSPHFFVAAKDMLAQGDMLMISASDGAAIMVIGNETTDFVTGILEINLLWLLSQQILAIH